MVRLPRSRSCWQGWVTRTVTVDRVDGYFTTKQERGCLYDGIVYFSLLRRVADYGPACGQRTPEVSTGAPRMIL